LESVLDAATILRDCDNIRFVFVGDGSARENLKRKAQRLALPNVQFVPYQPRERMPEVLASADVSLVTLRKGTGFGALPSKVYSILASSRPIIVSLDAGSDAWDLVERAGAGLCIPPEDPARLAESVQQLREEPRTRERLGKSGREYVLTIHSPEHAAQAFEALLEEAIAPEQQKDHETGVGDIGIDHHVPNDA
jgi:colanic acid biosynthesis glycosyl transferase WcaI